MPAKINLLNETFGKLKVIEETSQRKNKSIVWKCECDCGNIVEYSTKQLRSEGVISCPNCGKKREPKTNLRENIIGKKFNHLTVIEATKELSGGKIKYKCQCDCEKQSIVYVTRTDLQTNHTVSCGCARRKYNKEDIINNRKIIDYIGSKNKDGHYYYKCKCLLCNREYEALGATLEKTFSCGCQKSIGEFNIINILNQKNIKYQKEYIFPGSSYRFDFAIFENNQIIRLIEFDGEQHYENQIKNNGWNTYEKYQYTYKNDLAKNELAKEKNIPLVRVPYWERDNISYDLLFSDKYLIF